MKPRNLPPMAPLSAAEYDELEELLFSEDLPEDTLEISGLEGLITAVVIGPETVMPGQWLPSIFAIPANEPLPFASEQHVSRMVELIIRFYTEIVSQFEAAPEEFEPTFYVREVEGRSYMIVDEWCAGFIKGMNLTKEAWQPLLTAKPQLLRPIQLFGTPQGWDELKQAPDEASMHDEWSAKIAPAVRAIHTYWLPHRKALAARAHKQASPQPVSKTKIGRNEPCPCGSGKKYKNCCGGPRLLH